MTLQQLEYLVAIEQYQSFGIAAEHCNVTQSTISQLVRKLEQELDVIIFDRTKHPVAPTPIGVKVIEQARHVLRSAQQMRDVVVQQRSELVGTLGLGVASTIAPYVLPKIFKLIAAKYPHFNLRVEDVREDEALKKLEDSALDVALLATPLPSKAFLEVPLYREQFVAYVSPTDSLYAQPQLQVTDLKDHPMWMLRESYCPHGSDLAFCQHHGAHAMTYQAGTPSALVNIVDENGGLTIIPCLHIGLLNEQQRLNVRPFVAPQPQREVAFVVRPDFVNERMLNALLEGLKTVVPATWFYPRIQQFPIRL